ETTDFGMLLNLSANSPFILGQALAKPSYLTRPSSKALDDIASSSLNWSPSFPRLILNVQPAYLKSSPPPGASITPSMETNSVTIILPILCSPGNCQNAKTLPPSLAWQIMYQHFPEQANRKGKY